MNEMYPETENANDIYSEFYFHFGVKCDKLHSVLPNEDAGFPEAWPKDKEDVNEPFDPDMFKPSFYVERVYDVAGKLKYRLFMVFPYWNKLLAEERLVRLTNYTNIRAKLQDDDKAMREAGVTDDAQREEKKKERDKAKGELDALDAKLKKQEQNLEVVFNRDWVLLHEGKEVPKTSIEFDKGFNLMIGDGQNSYGRKQGGRIEIVENEMGEDCDFSGSGSVDFTWKGQDGKKTYRVRYQYHINFAYRKPIEYSVTIDRSKAIVKWESMPYGKPIEVTLRHDANGRPWKKLPGWRSVDRKLVKAIEFEQSKKKGGRVCKQSRTLEFSLKGADAVDADPDHYCLEFAEGADAKFYALRRIGGTNKSKRPEERKGQSEIAFCPYCLRPMRFHAGKKSEYPDAASFRAAKAKYQARQKAYREGAVSCVGKASIKLQRKSGANWRPIAGRFLCTGVDFAFQDGKITGKLKDNRMRLLPEHDYEKYPPYKIVMFGAPRVGKSTFLAALFNFQEGEVGNSRFLSVISPSDEGVQPISPVDIDEVEWSEGEGSTLRITPGKSWIKNTGKTYFKDYILPKPVGSFINQTQGDAFDDRKEVPFFFEYEKDLISIYDIPGEKAKAYIEADIAAKDRENKMPLLTGGRRGIFFIINGTASEDSTDDRETLEQLYTKISADLQDVKDGGEKDALVPIAIIVSKFDQLEGEFSVNAECRRGDIMLQEGGYAGSDCEENIEQASREIRSYLMERRRDDVKGVLEQLEDLYRQKGYSEQIRYFGVSAFQFKDSAKKVRKDEKSGESNVFNFASTPKRLELPVLWMLDRLGIMK